MHGPRILTRSGLSNLSYAAKVAARICVRCHATRMESEVHARCEECLEEIRKQRRSHYKRGGGRAAHRKYYRANKKAILKKAADRRLNKKLTGKCHDCPNLCMPDNDRCEHCANRNSEAARAAWAAGAPQRAAAKAWKGFAASWGRLRFALRHPSGVRRVATGVWLRALHAQWEELSLWA